MSRFFIDRPIFAWVIAIVIMLAGALSIFTPADRAVPEHRAADDHRSPPTTPAPRPRRSRTRSRRSSSSSMNGLDGLRYIYSTSDSNGQAQITLTFDAGTNPDIAQVQVQNKLQLATPLLPQEVQQQGVTRHQVGAQLPHGHRLRVGRRQHDRAPTSPTTSPPTCSTRCQPRRRRRRAHAVRLAVRDAHLARPEQAASTIA